MIVAWSMTEVLRYYFYAVSLYGRPPQAVVYLRYTLFFILYPLGAGSECWLVYLAIPAAEKISPYLSYGFWAILAIYVPGNDGHPQLADQRRLLRALHVHDKAASQSACQNQGRVASATRQTHACGPNQGLAQADHPPSLSLGASPSLAMDSAISRRFAKGTADGLSGIMSIFVSCSPHL